MIYKKEANFPYPLLTNTSDAYENCQFILDINLNENTNDYQFMIDTTIESEFIKQLIQTQKAKMFLVISSKDSQYYELIPNQTDVTISKTRISLSKRTTLQLLVQATEEICFASNDDLNGFFEMLKQDIVVPKHSVLGFSNCVTFDGSSPKPFQLFEKKYDPTLTSEIKVELGSDTIILHYKNDQFLFNDLTMSESLNHLYVYMGLQKALYKFIVEKDEENHAEVYLNDVEIGEDEGLNFKLYNLMRSKMVEVISTETIDDVITLISDKMVQKYSSAVRGLNNNEG